MTLETFEFNANEILTMASQIEIDSYNFYVDASKQVSDEDARNFLLKMASFEEKHKSFFGEMQEKLSNDEAIDLTFDPNQDGAAYCRSFASMQKLFDKPVNFADINDIIKHAINKEKDAIIFYTKMKSCVHEVNGKDRLDDIIAEEMSHIEILTEQLR